MSLKSTKWLISHYFTYLLKPTCVLVGKYLHHVTISGQSDCSYCFHLHGQIHLSLGEAGNTSGIIVTLKG